LTGNAPIATEIATVFPVESDVLSLDDCALEDSNPSLLIRSQSQTRTARKLEAEETEGKGTKTAKGPRRKSLSDCPHNLPPSVRTPF